MNPSLFILLNDQALARKHPTATVIVPMNFSAKRDYLGLRIGQTSLSNLFHDMGEHRFAVPLPKQVPVGSQEINLDVVLSAPVLVHCVTGNGFYKPHGQPMLILSSGASRAGLRSRMKPCTTEA